MERLAHLLLTLLDPERAHDIAVRGMLKRRLAPGLYEPEGNNPDIFKTHLFGTEINNPIGLAAGFDKNGILVDVAEDYGFGWVEVGSVTCQGGPGNERPRMFRVGDRDVMNRMGLNGEPAWMVRERLLMCRSQAYGVNIAKTHDPNIMGDAAIEDISESYRLLGGLGAYTVLNISCPNTAEGKTFEDPSALRELLNACCLYRRGRPLLVKLSPNIQGDDLEQILILADDFNLSGFICSNTLPSVHEKYGKGGRSGDAVRGLSVALVHYVTAHIKKVVIGCGGIFSAVEVLQYLKAGAPLVQVYNGFVRGPNAGPRFVHRVLELLE
ncbi:hypothetical protein LCGC14_0164990 [marine sediment metagenome]|uniref:dihydroorotate dehydrogenase (quinone) n=1 Tax=marine sediment metagenome TaxID=412755 RepID=A0A0F9UUZ2_9ZZZZ